MDRRQLGELGEKIAEKHLKEKGYKILDRNFSKRFSSGPLVGEIDLIAKKDGMISFIEVKALSGKTPFFPEQKVNLKKKRKIARMAQIWLQDHNVPLDRKWGIDVISITIDPKRSEIKHFKNIII